MDSTFTRIKVALLSVFDTAGILPFGLFLAERGVTLIATGGTAAFLRSVGLTIKEVKEVTGFSPLFGGLVKTLHPTIFAGILLDRDNPAYVLQAQELKIDPIDLVVVNLAPQEKMDIGGHALIRAAYKNRRHVVILTHPSQYQRVGEEMRQRGDVSSLTQRALAEEALKCVIAYDTKILKSVS